MAQKVLFNIAGRIAKSLAGPQAAEQLKLLPEYEDELKNIADNVSAIKEVLLKAEQRAKSPEVDNWLERVSSVLYEADDLLDDTTDQETTQDKKSKTVRVFFSKMNKFAYRLKMGQKIKAVAEKLDAIVADMKDFQFTDLVETPVRSTSRYSSYSFVRKEEVIGREEDKEAIKSLLDANFTGNISILPIVGTSGIGKTTLAQLIFKDMEFTNKFETKIWVDVPEDFDVKIIVKKILESAKIRKSKNDSMDALVNGLRKEMDGRKYFLVLDDLRNEDCHKWSCLKELLMGGGKGSRILITTRSVGVAMTTRTIQLYIFHGLGEKESSNLFRMMAFKKGQEPENSTITQIGNEIVRNCKGVPLLVITIGRSLYSKHSDVEWSDFEVKELPKIIQDNEIDVLSILKQSYNMLSPNLKECFAYCSLFPKSHVFDVSTLINHWIAQGFLELTETSCSEDIGYEYFMDLLSRSFFHKAELDKFGKIIRCKMHNVMHDFAMLMAGPLISDCKREIDKKTLHLANYSSMISISLSKAKKARTFLCPGVNKIFSGKFNTEMIFSSIKLLRVLDLRNRKLKYLPSSVGKLKHLRYLDLSCNEEVVNLPNSITKIHKLHTLRLSNCWSLEELPRDIYKLVHLRHLEIDGCWGLRCMPYKLGQLTNLQTLLLFVINLNSCSKNVGGLNELKVLNNLRGHLRIQYLSHAKDATSEYKDANLNDKCLLRSLELNWSYEVGVNGYEIDEDRMSLEGFKLHSNLKQLCLIDYRGSEIPKDWFSSLTNLVELKLSWCRKLKSLSHTTQLCSLKYLWLSSMHAMEYLFDRDDLLFFRSLEQIWLSDCPNLKKWRMRDSFATSSSFTALSKLTIEECPLLTSMPTFPHLEELSLYKANLKPLEQTMTMKAPSSKLKHLKLRSIMDLETLQKKWLQNLTSVKSLKIESCDKLRSLSPGIQCLTSLEHLELSFCPELKAISDKDGEWRDLKSLLYLSFKDLPQLMSLPSGLRFVTTLKNLEISYCGSLTFLPKWIHNSKSLEVLKIVGCSRLRLLPPEMKKRVIIGDGKDEEGLHERWEKER